MSLTVKEVQNAKPRDKQYKLFDGSGLYLLVKANGTKCWRWKYRIHGKEKVLALGVFNPKSGDPVTLKQARDLRHDAAKTLEQGIDPSLAKRLQVRSVGENSFEQVAREWFERYLKPKSASHYQRTTSYLIRDVFPYLGARPVADITAPEIIPVIDNIHKRVARDSHLRVLQSIGQIMRYAIATGRRTDPDPTPSLKGLFPPKEPKKHFPAITDPAEVGRLLRAIEHYSGNMITKCALQLSAIVMLRPGSFIRAEWSEVDFNNATWTIDVQHMKADTMVKKANREEDRHIIPLPDQAVSILKALIPLTGHSRYVFQSPATRKGREAPMSKDTVLRAIYRMGFQGEMSAHGFRSMASTLLNDMRKPDGSRMWDRDAIERQLSHKDSNQIRAAYDRGDYMTERRRMLQNWANHLDNLREGGRVIPFPAVSGE